MEEDKEENMDWDEIQDKFEEKDSSDDEKPTSGSGPNLNVRNANEAKIKRELEKAKKKNFFDGL